MIVFIIAKIIICYNLLKGCDMFDIKNILEQQKISGSAIIFIRHAENQKNKKVILLNSHLKLA